MTTYEIRAIRYGRFEGRTRRDSHIALAADMEDYAQPIDFFVYALTPAGGGETVVVDTGMTPEEGAARGRPTQHRPADVLARLGMPAGEIRTVILTHMHFDHGGTLGDFPAATFHVQRAEMESVAGADMGHPHLAEVYSAEHVCDLIRANFAGRVRIHEGDWSLAPGIDLHLIGGHAAGLQCLSVATARGPVVLACDAIHFYDNYDLRRPFRIVRDVRQMLDGYARVEALAPSRDHLIAGHDPSIMERWPDDGPGTEGVVARLDLPPAR
jgi:glyoxylase-like metal-dependent hydrolase (beta-lactamase superfamily II)